MIKNIVNLSKKAEKTLKKAPPNVQTKMALWKRLVENSGLIEVRKRKGYHDEPLKGDSSGQRSIRLNIQWRAIYETTTGIDREPVIELVDVVEVTPHKY